MERFRKTPGKDRISGRTRNHRDNNCNVYNSFTYFMDRQLDPYDAVAISIALHESVDVFVSRDGKLRRKTVGLIDVKEPEEL